jgi:predicted PurR-regulated permease PerM
MSNRITFVSYFLTGLALFVVLHEGLLSALLVGLLVYSLVHLLEPALGKNISSTRARIVAVAALSIFVVALVSLAIWGIVSFFQSDAGNMNTLLKKMADIIDVSRDQIPLWLRQHLPGNAEALQAMITSWLREHAVEAKSIGQEAGRGIAHMLIGMIIGAMVALNDAEPTELRMPLAAALCERAKNLSCSFQQIVFAQVRIAAINTILTALYIFVILPLSGIHLPLSKSLIVITFVAGLLPVIGNLISNSMLVVVALAHSLHIALASLLFMVFIHKLEYFLNARIIGAHIQAKAWELLVAMLVMESIFGLPGVIAAPVFYAYLKKELINHRLV